MTNCLLLDVLRIPLYTRPVCQQKDIFCPSEWRTEHTLCSYFHLFDRGSLTPMPLLHTVNVELKILQMIFWYLVSHNDAANDLVREITHNYGIYFSRDDRIGCKWYQQYRMYFEMLITHSHARPSIVNFGKPTDAL